MSECHAFYHMTTVLFLFFFFQVIKLAIRMFSYGAHFDQKVGTYIVAKLSQFASLKEPYVILAGPDSFFSPFLCHRIWTLIRGFSQ